MKYVIEEMQATHTTHECIDCALGQRVLVFVYPDGAHRFAIIHMGVIEGAIQQGAVLAGIGMLVDVTYSDDTSTYMVAWHDVRTTEFQHAPK